MKKFYRAGTVVFYIFFLAVIIYGIMGLFVLPNEKQATRSEFEFYTDNWTYVDKDGNTKLLEIPSKVDVPKGEVCRVQNVLPNIDDDDMYIIFRVARQDINIYIDGELRSSYSTDETRLFGKYSPTYYVMVKLEKEDSGKVIVAEYKAYNKNSGVVGEIYYANYTGFFRYEYQLQGGVFVIGIIMFIISVITLVLSMTLALMYKKTISLTSISSATLGLAIWILSNSVFRQFLAKNVSAITDISFVILPLIVAAFSAYVNQIMKKRYDKIYRGISILSLGIALITTLLHVLKIADYMDSFVATAVIFIALIVTTVVTMIIEGVRGYIKEYMVTAVSLIIAAACMLIQMVIYLKGGKAYDVSVAAIGLLIMLILATLDTIKAVYRTYIERDLAKYENDAKSQFLANMSHEIRTPINSILGMNAMIIRKSNDEEILGYANNIDRASNNLLSIVNDILDFSKIEAGKMELVPDAYDFTDLIKDTYNLIIPKITDKDIVYELDIDKNIPCGLFGDDVRIKQILINLLTNAVKYTNSGKVVLQVYKNRGEAASELSDDEVSLRFAVVDTGMGIKPDDLSKLTEKFVRIEESKNRNIEGTGLGINIVISLLNMMGSKLEVTSEYGEGSTFYFDLVQKITNSNPIGDINDYIGNKQVDADKYNTKLCIPNSRLLVVDDNEMNRMVFTFLTQEYECQVDDADSGKRCLELIKEHKYDMIFMDHMMPEMDGIETLRNIRESKDHLNTDTPIVVLTANAINGAEEEYMREGFDGYLSKPIAPQKLEEMLEHFIK